MGLRRRLAPALGIWLVSAALYAAYFQAQWVYGARPIFSITGDEPHYLTIATSLVSDGDLDVLDEYRDKEYFPYYPFHLGDARDMEDMHAIYGRSGAIYSKHSVGLPLLLAPAMRLGGYGVATLLMIALTAALSAQTWLLAREVAEDAATSGRRRQSVWLVTLAWAAVALTPPLLLYAPLFYPEVAGALLTVGGARGLVGFLRGGGARSLLVVGLCCGLLPWFHLRYAPIALVVGALTLWSVLVRSLRGGGRSTDALVLTVPPAIAGGGLFALNWSLFGGVPPVDEYGAISLARVVVGAPGLFFDRQFGLLPYAPVYALVPLGVVALWRRLPRGQTLALLLPFVTYAGFIACFSYWYGAFSPPARMLVPVLPLLVAPLVAAMQRWPAVRWVGGALLLVTLAISKLLVDVPRLRYHQPDGASGSLEYLSALWGRDVTGWLPTFIQPDGTTYLWTAVAIVALAAFSVAITRGGLRKT
jgi:hypothetical protein